MDPIILVSHQVEGSPPQDRQVERAVHSLPEEPELRLRSISREALRAPATSLWRLSNIGFWCLCWCWSSEHINTTTCPGKAMVTQKTMEQPKCWSVDHWRTDLKWDPACCCCPQLPTHAKTPRQRLFPQEIKGTEMYYNWVRLTHLFFLAKLGMLT